MPSRTRKVIQLPPQRRCAARDPGLEPMVLRGELRGGVPRVHIGEVVRNAVLFNPENSRERAVNSNLLINTARFFSLLREREIEHVLVGGIALLQYVEGRNTEVIDLIMTPSSFVELKSERG